MWRVLLPECPLRAPVVLQLIDDGDWTNSASATGDWSVRGIGQSVTRMKSYSASCSRQELHSPSIDPGGRETGRIGRWRQFEIVMILRIASPFRHPHNSRRAGWRSCSAFVASIERPSVAVDFAGSDAATS